jgi:hypothetical protein
VSPAPERAQARGGARSIDRPVAAALIALFCQLPMGSRLAAQEAVVNDPRARTHFGVDFSWVRSEGAEDCIAAEELRARVRDRIGFDPFVPPATYAIEGSVERSERGWSARLYERSATRVPRHLEISGEDCHELDDALVLALALALQSEFRSVTGIEPPLAPERSEDGTTSSRATTPSEPTEPALDRPHPVTDPTPREDAPPPPIDARPRDVRILAGASGSVDTVPGIAAGWTLRADAPLIDVLRLHVGAISFPEARTGGTSEIGIGLTAAIVGLCLEPIALPEIRLGGCLSVLAGAVHAVVHTPLPLEPGDRPWLATSLSLQASWVFAPPVGLWIELAGAVPWMRYEFRVQGRPQPEFVQPPVLPWVTIGLSLHFS